MDARRDWIDWMATPHVALGLIALHSLAILTLRLTFFPALANDEAEILRQTQVWSLTPDIKNPPLYLWLHKSAETLFGGPSMAVALAVKHACAALAGFAYLALARRAGLNGAWGGAGALALYGAHFWSVDATAAYTHSVLMVATGALALERALAFARKPDALHAWILGLACGLGLLSKWNFSVLGVGIIAALLLDKTARARMFGAPGIVFLVGFGAPTTPVLLALAGEWAAAEGLVARKFDMSSQWRGVEGALSVVANTLIALSPGVAASVAAAPRAALSGLRKLIFGQEPARRGAQIAGRAVLMAFLFTIIAIAATGAGRTRTHLTLVFAPLTVVALAAASAGGQGRRTARAATVIGAATAASGVAFIIGKAWVDGRGQGNAYANVRYDPVVQTVQTFDAGSVFTWEHPFSIAGNLRARHAAPAYFAVERQELATPIVRGPCVFIWRANHLDDDITPLRAFIARFGAPPDLERGVIVEAPYAFGRGRTVRFAVAPTTAPPGCASTRPIQPRSLSVPQGR